MKNIYKTIALCCAALSAVLLIVGAIAWFAGGKLFGHWWISYFNVTHYLMLFGVLILLLVIADREPKKE